MAIITHHRIYATKRMAMYPTNGLMPTRLMVKLEGSKVWRRVYERVEDATYRRKIKFRAVVKDDGVMRDLTDAEQTTIGYRL